MKVLTQHSAPSATARAGFTPQLQYLFTSDGPRMPSAAHFGLESHQGCRRPNRTTADILELAGSSVESSPRGLNSTDSRRAIATSGFTLIEMIAVLLILTVLVGILVSQVGGAQELVESKLARVQLEQIAVAAAEYEVELGDYPSSHFESELGSAPNAINLGVERLILALWSDGFDGCGLSPDDLDNTDDDRSAKPLSDLPTNDLFELIDPWGNPIAYFHHTDYEREDIYRTYDGATGEIVDGRVRALRNPKTKLFFEHRRFQLICAGPDGLFATEDDITNFKQ